jgi:phosphoglycerate dehydrogenase-like enzyme
VLAVADTPETREMIGVTELAAMKSSAILINVARGTVIDEPALVTALRGSPVEIEPRHRRTKLSNGHADDHVAHN